ncbi:unnamed protein product [Amaranthus hypochondriacus]
MGDKNKSIEENQSQDLDDILMYSSTSSSSSSRDYSDVGILSDVETLLNVPLEPLTKGKPYKILTEENIRKYQESDIKNISEILNITQAEAALVLVHCNWNVSIIPDRWFNEGTNLRRDIGLTEIPYMELTFNAKQVNCGMCAKEFPQELIPAPCCGHTFCINCWAGYIGTRVNMGMKCLVLRCPVLKCNSALDKDMIHMLASNADRDLYDNYLMRSYIECNFKAKWCPGPSCTCAVILEDGNSYSKVTCECGYSFCWKCTKEPHQPVNCIAANNWIMESHKQSQNMAIVNTKCCPNCAHSFEANDRYKRVQCASCNHQFCKTCLSSWLEQGFWEADQFTHICPNGKGKQVINFDDEERQKRAEEFNKKYQNFHTQWMNHDMGLQAAYEEIQNLKNGPLLRAVADKQGIDKTEMSFVTDAWEQIVDCKRFFKWACVFEFYLTDSDNPRLYLFHYLLRRGEVVLERLYQQAGNLSIYSIMEQSSPQFLDFRHVLQQKTSVACNFFKNMVWALGNNHSDLNTLRQDLHFRLLESGPATPTEDNNEHKENPWICAHCHFPNDGSTICVMCYY